MNMTAPIGPEKAGSSRFVVVEHASHGWAVVDVQRPSPIALCPDDERDAPRIAYSLNTIGRLLGDPGKPYMIEDVERLADGLDKVAGQCRSRSVQAFTMGETETSQMFGAESNLTGAGASMLRRMLAELLKFAIVGDSVEDQAAAWLEQAHPGLTSGTFETLTARQYILNLLDAHKAGAVVGMMRAKAGVLDVAGVAERIICDVGELPDRNSPEDWPEAMLVTGEELALIVRRALGEDI